MSVLVTVAAPAFTKSRRAMLQTVSFISTVKWAPSAESWAASAELKAEVANNAGTPKATANNKVRRRGPRVRARAMLKPAHPRAVTPANALRIPAGETPMESPAASPAMATGAAVNRRAPTAHLRTVGQDRTTASHTRAEEDAVACRAVARAVSPRRTSARGRTVAVTAV